MDDTRRLTCGDMMSIDVACAALPFALDEVGMTAEAAIERAIQEASPEQLRAALRAAHAEIARLAPPAGCHFLAVSDALFPALREWSEPVRVMVAERDDRIAELQFEKVKP